MNPIRRRLAVAWWRARALEVRVVNPVSGERATRGRDEAEAARLMATRDPSSRASL